MYIKKFYNNVTEATSVVYDTNVCLSVGILSVSLSGISFSNAFKKRKEKKTKCIFANVGEE